MIRIKVKDIFDCFVDYKYERGFGYEINESLKPLLLDKLKKNESVKKASFNFSGLRIKIKQLGNAIAIDFFIGKEKIVYQSTWTVPVSKEQLVEKIAITIRCMVSRALWLSKLTSSQFEKLSLSKTLILLNENLGYPNKIY